MNELPAQGLFYAVGCYTTSKHDVVYSVLGIEGFNPRTLAGQDVIIDGEQYHVKAVETWAAPDSLVTGKPFGLMVES